MAKAFISIFDEYCENRWVTDVFDVKKFLKLVYLCIMKIKNTYILCKNGSIGSIKNLTVHVILFYKIHLSSNNIHVLTRAQLV